MIYYVDSDTNKPKMISDVKIDNLEYIQEKQTEEGNNEIGYVFDYNIYNKSRDVLVGQISLFYSPEIVNEMNESKKIFLYLLWEIKEEMINKNIFNGLMNDTSIIIKKYYNKLYKKCDIKPKYFLVECFYYYDGARKYYTHGDYAIAWD